ncbi:Transposase OS=Streptomyces griseomycini OX=66895 GN=FHS37_006276 PE=4 SV=1 [Streptomyces griseomycini]|uniref:Transposase n=1 Tax=Streptomyces griseomycini TaxID=66895 RepID=A0A7W7PVS6_9ACTN|nr:transposase [Streptomyces griseomycini]
MPGLWTSEPSGRKKCGLPRTSSRCSRWSRIIAPRASRVEGLGQVSPVEYSSGRRRTRRLNHGGDRQANAALHRIVFTRLRHDPRTQAYYQRRIQEGKTRREIIRCLKRYAAREVFNLVRPISRAPAL